MIILLLRLLEWVGRYRAIRKRDRGRERERKKERERERERERESKRERGGPQLGRDGMAKNELFFFFNC